MKRHAIGVPRRLMILGQAMSRLSNGRGVIEQRNARLAHQRKVTGEISEVAGNVLARSYLQGELRRRAAGVTPLMIIAEAVMPAPPGRRMV